MGVERRCAPQSGQAVRVVSCDRGESLLVCFAGPVVGLITHWNGGRSWGCQGGEKCPQSLHKLRSVWKGYAAVRIWEASTRTWTPFVLEVTENLEESLRGRALRGEVWMISRESGRKKNLPVQGVYHETLNDAALLVEFSVVVPLQRMYHVLDLDLGRENPLPSKLILPAIAATPPTLPSGPEPAPLEKPTAEQTKQLREMIASLGGRRKAQASPPSTSSSNGPSAAHS